MSKFAGKRVKTDKKGPSAAVEFRLFQSLDGSPARSYTVRAI